MAEVLKPSSGDTHWKNNLAEKIFQPLGYGSFSGPLDGASVLPSQEIALLGFGVCQYGVRGERDGVLSGKVEFCRTFAPSFLWPRSAWGLGPNLKELWQSPHVCTHSGCSELETKKCVLATKLDTQQILLSP